MEKSVKEYFKCMTAYTPTFTTFEGGIYEMELTRAAIHSFATHCSKLKPIATNDKALERVLGNKPNPLMDTKKYLYRLATIVSVDNNVIIAPLYNNKGQINGFYPLLGSKSQLVKDRDGNNYIKYDFGNGEYGARELESVGIMNQFQYSDELFGESNNALRPTMELLNTHNQGILNGVKNAASIRFLARLAMTLKDEDLRKERERFTEENLSADNNGGVMMFDQKYADVKQVESKPFIVDPAQEKSIKENVFYYFGTNEKILTNSFNSSEWNAYYEGKIEPFAIEAGLVHTNMTYTDREISFGREIVFVANRLQYLSGEEKLNMVTQLFDRGFLTHNEGREIFSMPPVEDGDKYYIRKEYAQIDNLDEADNVLRGELNDGTDSKQSDNSGKSI